MRVLVVDDNLLSCTRLLSQAHGAGWQAQAVGLGPEGLTQARQRHPDVIIVNLAAAVSDATLFVRALKAEPDLASIPVVGFCGHREVHLREAALAAGCDRVVSNSSVSAEMPALVRSLVTGASRIDQGA